MDVITTLNFMGHTEAALDFYREAVGARRSFLLRFRDCPHPWLVPAGFEDKVFHATFAVGETTFMASDVGCAVPGGATAFSGFALAVRAESAEHAGRMFAALSDGGTVVVPLAASAFTGLYGIVVDRFGLSWKVTVEADAPADAGPGGAGPATR